MRLAGHEEAHLPLRRDRLAEKRPAGQGRRAATESHDDAVTERHAGRRETPCWRRRGTLTTAERHATAEKRAKPVEEEARWWPIARWPPLCTKRHAGHCCEAHCWPKKRRASRDNRGRCHEEACWPRRRREARWPLLRGTLPLSATLAEDEARWPRRGTLATAERPAGREETRWPGEARCH